MPICSAWEAASRSALPHVGTAAEQFGGNAHGHFRRHGGNGPVAQQVLQVGGRDAQQGAEGGFFGLADRSISSGRIWAAVCARLLLACSKSNYVDLETDLEAAWM